MAAGLTSTGIGLAHFHDDDRHALFQSLQSGTAEVLNVIDTLDVHTDRDDTIVL